MFESRIKIREFIFDFEKGNINSLEVEQKALLFKKDISNNISFFYNEIKGLSKINRQFENIKELKYKFDKENDEKYLYLEVKFCSPKRWLLLLKLN